MAKTRKDYSPKVKFQAVLELLRGDKSATEIARAWGAHSTTIRNWRDQFMKKGPEVFSLKNNGKEKEEKIAELQKIIGQQTVEIALLKKFLGS